METVLQAITDRVARPKGSGLQLSKLCIAQAHLYSLQWVAKEKQGLVCQRLRPLPLVLHAQAEGGFAGLPSRGTAVPESQRCALCSLRRLPITCNRPMMQPAGLWRRLAGVAAPGKCLQDAGTATFCSAAPGRRTRRRQRQDGRRPPAQRPAATTLRGPTSHPPRPAATHCPGCRLAPAASPENMSLSVSATELSASRPGPVSSPGADGTQAAANWCATAMWLVLSLSHR